MSTSRAETDSLGPVEIPEGKLWGAQTQRAIEHFSIGRDLIPAEMIAAYAIVKRGAAKADHDHGSLGDKEYRLITQVCDEILAGRHWDMFPLHVWMSGSGTQFNMNVNEVIANRCAEIEGLPLGGKRPAHPNDHVNMSQSTNDTFPTAMHIAAATGLATRLIPAILALCDAIGAKAEAWASIIKIGRTHLQDATPLTLARSGWVTPPCCPTTSSGSRRRSRACIRWRSRDCGRHRRQRACGFRRGGDPGDRAPDVAPLRPRNQ